MQSLQNVIHTYLGDNLGNLGSQRNLYLSYDATTGWAVKDFAGCIGTIQKFFRWLGFYANTHLKTVRDQLQREANVPPQLLSKIEACWQRQHPSPLPRIHEERMHLERGPVHANRLPLVVGEAPNETLFVIEAGDLIHAPVKAIVNPSCPDLLPFEQGMNRQIHDAAGPELLTDSLNLPIVEEARCPIGQAVITRSGALAQHGIERVIHAAIDPLPTQGSSRRETIAHLKSAYVNALNLAYENGIRSIAFPPLGAGTWYPMRDHMDFIGAVTLGAGKISHYLRSNPGRFNEVRLIIAPELFAEVRGAILIE
jgi:O-acetyl-ADP-ribose deacetylase (regulator of RNase III)